MTTTERLWQPPAFNSSIQGTPVLAGDVLALSTEGNLYGLSLYDGSQKWSYQIASGIQDIVAADGSLFFMGRPSDYGGRDRNNSDPGGNGGNGGNDPFHHGGGHQGNPISELVVLDAGSGQFKENWKDANLQLPVGLRNPMVESGILVLSDGEGNLYGYDIQSPQQLWQHKVSQAQLGPAGLGDDAVFFVSNGILYGVNVKSGQTRWQFSDSNHGSFSSALAPFVGQAVTRDDTLQGMVILADGQTLYGLDWRTGDRLWTIYVPEGGTLNAPVVSWNRNCLFATTTNGEVYGYELSSGQEFWHSTLSQLASDGNVQGQSGGFFSPAIDTDITVIDQETGRLDTISQVFLPARSGAVFILELHVNQSQAHLTPQQRYRVSLATAATNPSSLSCAPAIGNDAIVMTHASQISAYTFARGKTAYFPPENNAHISIQDNSKYALGTGDFGMEVWVRTTTGGVVLAQSPTTIRGENGFRLDIASSPTNPGCSDYGEGRIQFSISAFDASLPVLVQTATSTVSDGYWHHVAVVRTRGEIAIFLDGVSQPVEAVFYDKTAAVGNALQNVTVGAYLPSDPSFYDDDALDFNGLIADVRLWHIGPTAKQIQDRLPKLLTGREPGLAGYWPLNESDPSGFKNSVDDRPVLSHSGVRSLATNLALDDSLFPYLLNQVEAEWPYQERWTVRGEDAPKTAAVGASEVLCFATDRALYAVDLIHGKRQWGIDGNAFSTPSTNGHSFYVLESTTVLAIEPDTGTQNWQTNLQNLNPRSGAADSSLLSPVATQGCVVASADRQKIYWLDKNTGELLGYYQAPAKIQSELLAKGNVVYFCSGNAVYQFTDPSSPSGSLSPTHSYSPSEGIGGTSHMAIDAGKLFLYDGTTVRLLDAKTLDPPQKVAWNPAPLSGIEVTGMVASANLNRLILSTTQGTLLFWEYGSGKQVNRIPIPNLQNGSVFAPVLYGEEVYCTASGTLNGRSGGGIWVFDAKTGALRGCDAVDTPPNASPYIDAGTAFFPCNDGGSTGKLDGEALYSVVFGHTYALKREAGDAALEISGSNVTEVFNRKGENCFRAGNFSVEAWINTDSASGGHIISLPMSQDSGGVHGGFQLSVQNGGQICAQYLYPGYHSQFTSGNTAALDGKWHHIAAVFRWNSEKSQELCYLYLDGQPLTGVKYRALSGITPQGSDRRVEIGANFQGLMHDIRVWSTWLHAAEISARRNVRLRGDEPNLLACWNFSRKGVYDDSIDRLNAPNIENLDFWLTDLSFVAPSYPYLFAKSTPGEVITRRASEGHGATIDTATYHTQIIARQANGSPRANTKLKIWLSEPATLLAVSGSITHQSSDRTYYEATTDATGQFKADLSCRDVSHSPSLEVNADFMYANERFYVSPAIESQKHVIVPPPPLTAQSTLIQDYSYNHGDSLGTNHGQGHFTLHGHVDITTVQTTVKAITSQGNPMPNESLEVWSDGHLSIEVEGKSYAINPHNSRKFKTGPDGSLTIVLHEDSNQETNGNLVNIPSLEIRAGFMPRSSRFVVNPSENCHKTLSSVTADQIQGHAPIAPDKPKAALQSSTRPQNNSAIANKAHSIAQMMNHVMGMTKTHQAAGLQNAGMAGGNGRSEALTPNEALAPADAILSVHNSAHIRYNAPITPEYMPHPHFVFSLDGENASFTHFDTTADLDNHLEALGLGSSDALFASGQYGGDDDPAGGWFKSLWHDIKKGFEDLGHDIKKAWDDVKHFVVKTWDEVKHDVSEVIHHVEVAIVNAVGKVTKWIIKTVKDAVDHIVAFFKKVWVILKDIYNFLRALFDWGSILAVHRTISYGINQLFDHMKTVFGITLPNDIREAVTLAKANVDEALKTPLDDSSLESYKHRNVEKVSTCTSHTKSSKSNYLVHKVKTHGTAPSQFTSAPQTGQGTDLKSDLSQLIAKVEDIFTQPGGLTHLSLQEILNLLDDAIRIVLDIAEELSLALVDAMKILLDVLSETLNAELHIPFISELYHLITGSSLTILDVIALISAVPAHIVLAVVGVSFDEDEVKNLFHHGLSSLSGTEDTFSEAAVLAYNAGAGQKVVDIYYLTFTILGGILLGIADIQAAITPGALKLADAVITFIAKTLAPFAVLSHWLLANIVSPGGWNVKDKVWVKKVIFFVGLIPPLMSIALAIPGAAGKVRKIRFMSNAPEIVTTFLGVFLVGMTVVSIVFDVHKDTTVVIEDVLGFTYKLPLSFKFCNLKSLVDSSEGISSVILSSIDIAAFTVVAPTLHMTGGFGPRIWNY